MKKITTILELMEQREQSQACLSSAESRQKSTECQLADDYYLVAPDFPSFGQYTFGTPEGSVGPDGYSLDYYYC